MKTEVLEIQRDGLTLRGFQSLPDAESFDVAIIFHGFLKNCGRQGTDLVFQISEALNARGIGTVRMDFAGQGESGGASTDMSVLSELLDASAILHYVRTIPGVRRIFVHGQSQGAVVASMIAGTYPDWIDRVALTAPAAALVDDAIEGKAMGKPFDPIHVPEVQNFQGQDIGGFYFRTNQKLNIYDWAKNYDRPAIIVHSRNDIFVSYHYAERFHEVMKQSELHILPGGNHSMSEGVREETVRLVADFFAAE